MSVSIHCISILHSRLEVTEAIALVLQHFVTNAGFQSVLGLKGAILKLSLLQVVITKARGSCSIDLSLSLCKLQKQKSV